MKPCYIFHMAAVPLESPCALLATSHMHLNSPPRALLYDTARLRERLRCQNVVRRDHRSGFSAFHTNEVTFFTVFTPGGCTHACEQHTCIVDRERQAELSDAMQLPDTRWIAYIEPYVSSCLKNVSRHAGKLGRARACSSNAPAAWIRTATLAPWNLARFHMLMQGQEISRPPHRAPHIEDAAGVRTRVPARLRIVRGKRTLCHY